MTTELKAMPGRCEEASPLSGAQYIPCNAPASRIVGFPNTKETYRMCQPCAWHNTKNRGAIDMGPFVPIDPSAYDNDATKREKRSEAPSFLKAAVKDAPKVAPSEDKLTALRAKVAEFRDATLERQNLEERLEGVSATINDLQHRELPTMFDEIGIDQIRLSPEGNNPGVEAKAGPFYKAVISQSWDDEKKQDAFACLSEEGAEDLIKVTVTVAFPRGAFEEAQTFAAECRKRHMQVILKEEVHHGTLTSWLKDSCERGHVPPLDRIGGILGRIVKLKVLKS